MGQCPIKCTVFLSKSENIAPRWAFKLHSALTASDLAFSTPNAQGELSRYGDFFFFCRYTKQGSLKDHTDCAPNNGYYFLPLYDKGEYVLKVRHFDEGQELQFRISQCNFTKSVRIL
jgi:hypothetical protein